MFFTPDKYEKNKYTRQVRKSGKRNDNNNNNNGQNLYIFKSSETSEEYIDQCRILYILCSHLVKRREKAYQKQVNEFLHDRVEGKMFKDGF